MASLEKIESYGETLTLSNGDVWSVEPSDMPTAFAWVEGTDVRAERMDDGNSYDWQLTSSLSGTSVRARKN